MKTFLEALKTFISALASGTGKTLSVYGKILKGYAKFALITSLCLLPLPAAGIFFKMPWLVGTYIAILGILSVMGLVLLSPILAVAKTASDRISSFKKTLVRLLSFLFWLLAIAIYFFVIPVGNPATFILVILIFGLMALGYAAFGIRTSPRLAFGLAVIVLIILTLGSVFSSLLPNSKANLANRVRTLDKGITTLITPDPKRVDLKYFTPFDPKDGKAKAWYYKSHDGRFEFYNRPGYHWSGAPLREITPKVIDEYMESLAPKPDMTPKKVDIFSYEPFDLKDGKPRVWYYQSLDGKYEFYNKPGFHWTGEQLKLITTQVVADWQKAELKRKKVEEEQRIEKERQLQIKADEERQKASGEKELQRQIEANRRETEKVKDRLAKNIVPTPLPSPPSERIPTPTLNRISERVFQVWVDNTQSPEKVSSLTKLFNKIARSRVPYKVPDQFKSKNGVVNTTMYLIGFDHPVSTEQVCSYFSERGLRPAVTAELFFLMTQHPETYQSTNLALAAACQKNDQNHKQTSYSSINYSIRGVEEVQDHKIVGDWDKENQFAAVLVNTSAR